jgi:hypothetical protein
VTDLGIENGVVEPLGDAVTPRFDEDRCQAARLAGWLAANVSGRDHLA